VVDSGMNAIVSSAKNLLGRALRERATSRCALRDIGRLWSNFTVIFGALLLGCRLGTIIRGESANSFSMAPVWLTQEDAITWTPQIHGSTGTVHVPSGFHTVASDLDAGGSGVIAASADAEPAKATTVLFQVRSSTIIGRIPLPEALTRNSFGEVHFLSDAGLVLVGGDRQTSRLSFIEDELREVPYHGDLFLINLRGDVLARHLFAHSARLSPDSAWMLYWRSDIHGHHNLFVTSPVTANPRFVCSLMEADPGSGESFEARWSMDSRFLKIEGQIASRKEIGWIYDVKTGNLYELPPLPFLQGRLDVSSPLCKHHEWTAKAVTTFFQAPNLGSSPSFYLRTGESAYGLGELLVTRKLGRVVAKRSLELSSDGERRTKVPTGAVLYALSHEGQGFTRVWYHGRIYRSELPYPWDWDSWKPQPPNSFAPYENERFRIESAPSTQRWVEARNGAGLKGWTHQIDHLEGIDSCK
jgi:hypothetical protein